MSHDYRLNLVWTSHGQQLRADIERNIGQLVGWDNQVRKTNREMGLWGQQMRAIGTTIRYALAGAVIYGTAGAVQGLGQFLDRLGQIDSLAGRMDERGRFQGLGRQLNEIGDMAVELSLKWGIAVDDIQQHMIRFYSSFGDQVRGQQGLNLLREYSKEMANLSMIAEGADPQQLGGGVAGLVIGQTGPGRRPNPAQFGRMTDIIARVLQETPTITGQDIARDVGRLSSAVVAANMSPEQVFAAYGLAARAGGSGAVIGRGITQLFTSELIRPQTEQQQAAFRRAGLPTDPTALRDIGGFEILKRMMTAVAPGGFRVRNRLALGDEGLDDEQAIAGAGISGINLTLGSQLFGRQESFRQFLNLMANGGVPALNEFIKGIREAEKTRLGAQMAEDRNRQRTYQQFSQLTHDAGLQLARGLDPAMRPVISKLNKLGRWAFGGPEDQQAGGHVQPWQLAAGAGTAGGSALAARLIFGSSLTTLAGRGMARIPGVGGMLNRMGLGKLISRAPALSAAALVGGGLGAFDATGEGQQRSGSRSNPYWVVIDPLSWFMPGAPNAAGFGGGGGAEGDRHSPPLAVLRRNWRSTLRGSAAATALLASPIVAQEAANALRRREERQGRVRGVPGGHPLLQALSRPTRATGFDLSGLNQPSDAQQRILSAFVRHKISADVAENRLRILERGGPAAGRHIGSALGAALSGQADVTIILEPTDELKGMIRGADKRTHVPVKLWPKGEQRQTFRGKQKTQRGAGSGR